MRRESTLMASRSGSAFSPTSATLPLMVTRPSWISSSALRREVATPARARIFCRRSSLMGSPPVALRLLHRQSVLLLLHLGHLAQEPLLAVGVRGVHGRLVQGPSRQLGEPRHGRRVAAAEGLLELLQGRQVPQTVEPDVHRELSGGAVEERLAHHLLA